MEQIVGPSGRAVGVDASAEMIAEAKQRAAAGGSRAEFFVCSAEALDLPAASFDAARTERVLMHVADPLRVLREISRVLRPGGRLVCSEPDHQMSAIAADDGVLADGVFRGLNAHTKSPRVGRELRALFAGAGFAEVEVTVEPLVITSLAQFWAGSVSGPEEFVKIAASLRLAGEPQLRALLAEWEARDARGAFFACLVGMCARGVRR
jgi:ubiquinone/menaquinone biosynthesis C-methylase UbiE